MLVKETSPDRFRLSYNASNNLPRKLYTTNSCFPPTKSVNCCVVKKNTEIVDKKRSFKTLRNEQNVVSVQSMFVLRPSKTWWFRNNIYILAY